MLDSNHQHLVQYERIRSIKFKNYYQHKLLIKVLDKVINISAVVLTEDPRVYDEHSLRPIISPLYKPVRKSIRKKLFNEPRFKAKLLQLLDLFTGFDLYVLPEDIKDFFILINHSACQERDRLMAMMTNGRRLQILDLSFFTRLFNSRSTSLLDGTDLFSRLIALGQSSTEYENYISEQARGYYHSFRYSRDLIFMDYIENFLEELLSSCQSLDISSKRELLLSQPSKVNSTSFDHDIEDFISRLSQSSTSNDALATDCDTLRLKLIEIYDEGFSDGSCFISLLRNDFFQEKLLYNYNILPEFLLLSNFEIYRLRSIVPEPFFSVEISNELLQNTLADFYDCGYMELVRLIILIVKEFGLDLYNRSSYCEHILSKVMNSRDEPLFAYIIDTLELPKADFRIEEGHNLLSSIIINNFNQGLVFFLNKLANNNSLELSFGMVSCYTEIDAAIQTANECGNVEARELLQNFKQSEEVRSNSASNRRVHG